MNDYKIRRQQWRYLCCNLLAFTVIFALFATIIYLQISRSLFQRVDEDLDLAQRKIMSAPEYVQMQLSFSPDNPPWKDNHGTSPDNAGAPGSAREAFGGVPMRVQVVIRGETGEVLNGRILGRLFWEDTLSAVPFSAERLDSIQNFSLEDGSHFRSLSFALQDREGAAYYIQLLASADGEHAIISSFTNILVVCVLVFILLSFTASYLLSKQNMAPVLRAWERQTEFVENASHELRTPLTIIQNKLESLFTTPQATVLDKADSIAVALSETRRLSKLTGDLMTLARADSNEPLLKKEAFELDSLIETVAVPYAELAEAQGKSMELALRFPKKITADRGRIHELMVILLDNALKYTAEGDSIRITTQQKDNRVVLRVTDTGIGIKEESATRIFDRFYREDKARTREHGGTGLGLSIALWIVDSHDGTIKAEPNRPRGTVFEVRLPVG